MIPLASPADLASARLAHWSHDDARRALHRRLVFTSFGQALSTMVEIGFEAERADHHPEWTNVYDRLDIWLTTHDAGGVTARDLEMAAVIDRIVARRGDRLA